MSVITQPSNAESTLREAKADFPYVWLMHREPPDPDPFWRIIRSDHDVSEFGAVGTTVHLRGRKMPRQNFREWRIKAAFVHGDQKDGESFDLDQPYKFHTVETR